MIISYIFKCVSGGVLYAWCSSLHACFASQDFAKKYMQCEASVCGPKRVHTGNLQTTTVWNFSHAMDKLKMYFKVA